jgi:nucleotidyltransferase/DNA polymerase involved in DNA repair
VIIHLDADAFFASCEQAADSRLRGKAVAVGGVKRGIIASASYEARRMGVYTPMPTAHARRTCPKLIVIPGDFSKYEHFSRMMFSYAYDFTPDVEVGSIGEGYFDLRSPLFDHSQPGHEGMGTSGQPPAGLIKIEPRVQRSLPARVGPDDRRQHLSAEERIGGSHRSFAVALRLQGGHART